MCMNTSKNEPKDIVDEQSDALVTVYAILLKLGIDVKLTYIHQPALNERFVPKVIIDDGFDITITENGIELWDSSDMSTPGGRIRGHLTPRDAVYEVLRYLDRSDNA